MKPNISFTIGLGFILLTSLAVEAQSINVTSTGVGIGTTTPLSKLTSYGPSVNPANGISTFAITTTGSFGGGIGFQDGSGNFGIWVDTIGTAARFGFVSNLGPLSNTFSILSSGNIGIGTAIPSYKIDVFAGNLGTNTGDRLNLAQFQFMAGNGEYLRIFGKRSVSGPDWATGDVYIQRTVDGSDQGFVKFTDWGVAFGSGISESMRVAGNGSVGIGTTAPSQKLEVAGSVKATSFISATKTYADYVFSKDYKLTTLSEVEKHIAAEGHLPGIPSEKEARINGIDLGDMQVRLLAQVEQLTLHMIEHEKALEALKQENVELKRELKTALEAGH